MKATAAAPRRAWVRQLMGMPISVHLRGDAARTATAEQSVLAAFDTLRAVDVLFSTYRAGSEVCRLDRGELTIPDVHPLVGEVIGLCEVARTRTGGAFDAYRADPADGRLRFDPTGLVKGWAVERAARSLTGATGCDVSINAGGDIAGVIAGVIAGPITGSIGRRPARPWRVGVEDPRDPTRLLAVLPLPTGGVATSGTARRGGHIVAPRDGSPVTELLSVTVLGPSLLWADVYATAAFVKGAAALDWLETMPGYEGIVVDRAGVRTTRNLPVATGVAAGSAGTGASGEQRLAPPAAVSDARRAGPDARTGVPQVLLHRVAAGRLRH